MNASFADTATGLLITSLEEVTSQGRSKLEIREWNALIGIVTAIVGNILISFALNIQRYAHIRLNHDRDRRQKGKRYGAVDYSTEQARIAGERATLNLNAPSEEEREAGHDTYEQNGMDGESTHSRSSSESTVRQEKNQEEAAPSTTYLKSPYWWAGILLMTTGEAGNFLAYGFAPASIVSPLGVVALISNCIIAPWLLKERFRQRDFWGVVVAIGGAVTVVLSAKNSETKMGPHDVWKAITRWEFEVYLGVTAGLIITLMWASGRYGDRTILIDLGLVGLFGAYTALSTKGVASLLSDTLWRALTFPITYLLVFVLVSTALLQIRYVNRALQRFDSTQVIPTQFVLFTLSVIIGSAVLYRDFESATVDRVLKFIGGCAMTFLGVYYITSGRSGDESGEDEEGEDEDQPIALVDEEARGTETAAVQFKQFINVLTPDHTWSRLTTAGKSMEFIASTPAFATILSEQFLVTYIAVGSTRTPAIDFPGPQPPASITIKGGPTVHVDEEVHCADDARAVGVSIIESSQRHRCG
ncbi:hypothetical protein MMC30_005349 [Trapelia coarctata]|nr:hypothetical protein [Trapelia coarctata]